MPKKKPSKQQTREIRLRKAIEWLESYTGTKVIRAYRKRFGVDVNCAIKDLQEIGYEFQPGYIENLKKSEAPRMEQLRRKRELKKQVESFNPDQDETFFFIAGYTSGGAPYGVTWEEMGLKPWEELE